MKNVKIHEINDPRRRILEQLFSDDHRLRAMIDAVLDGSCGTAYADARRDPKVAHLKFGPFNFLSGDPTHPAAKRMIEDFSKDDTVVAKDEDWKFLMMRSFECQIGTVRRHRFSSNQILDSNHLRFQMSKIPDEFRLRRIDIELAVRLNTEVSPYLILAECFCSDSDFVNRGFGFCVENDGKIVAAATTAILSDHRVGIQVNTNEPFRRIGLGTAVAAATIVQTCERGLLHNWDTADTASIRVAEKLGYVLEESYDVLELEG